MKYSDEELLEKLQKAAVLVDAVPTELQEKNRNEFVEQVKSMQTPKASSFKVIFGSVMASVCFIFAITMAILMPSLLDNRRYCATDPDVQLIDVDNNLLPAIVPAKVANMILSFDDSEAEVKMYTADSKKLALQIVYASNNKNLFIILNNRFDYDQHSLYEKENTTITKAEKYTEYYTEEFVKIGRKTIIHYYVLLKTDKYQYYLEMSNIDEQTLNDCLQKVIDIL